MTPLSLDPKIFFTAENGSKQYLWHREGYESTMTQSFLP